nr:putative phosphoserine phosphatase SerB [uncultured bacterium]
MGILSAGGAAVQDIEQIVVRGRLNLELVVDVPEGRDVLKDILMLGWERGLDIDFDVVAAVPKLTLPALVVSIVGDTLTPLDLQLASAAIAKAGGNIERIRRLAKEPVWCYEFEVRGSDPDGLRAQLIDVAAENPRFDVAIQRTGLYRRAQRLIVMDVDSTLIQNEMIDLLADEAGFGPQCAAITERAMAGELDFEEALSARVSLLVGQPDSILQAAYDRLDLTPGAARFVKTLQRLGYKVAIVSGGFSYFTDRLKTELGLDYSHANTLEIRNGLLTGNLVGAVVDRKAKASMMMLMAQQEGVALEQVVAIGDGANDLDMLAAAGLGVAFCAKQVVREAASATLSIPHLDAILFLLGVRSEELELDSESWR